VNKDELKRLVRKQRSFDDGAWDLLDRWGFEGEALDMAPDEEAVAYMLEKLAELDAATSGGRSRRQTEQHERDTVVVSLSEAELQRQAAFEEYAAFRAARAGGTRWFRDEVLRNRLLTADQARELIRSPAARFLEASSFEFAGGEIPLIGHHATLEGYERVEGDTDWQAQHRATVSVDPPGMTESVENMFDEAPQLAPRRPRFKDGTHGQALYYVNERGRPRKVSVWDRSLLERLRGLSEELVQEYRWEPAQSTMFVLTGEIPPIPPLKVTNHLKSTREIVDATTSVPRHIDATITITASPWVRTRTVRSNYRKAQIKVLGSSGGKPPSERNLTLFRFVIERIQSLSEPAAEAIASRAPGRARMPEGKELVREWNKTYPQWEYKTSVGDPYTRWFWKDFKRILKTIAVGPPYQGYRAAADRQSRQTDGS
jgi:hypothetical protein